MADQIHPLRQVIAQLRRFVDVTVTGSRRHGAFGRGFTGEYVPHPHMMLDELEAALAASQESPKTTIQLPPDVTIKMLETSLAVAEGKLAACAPFLKDGETPAQCIERNRRGMCAALSLLAKEKLRTEALAAAPQESQPRGKSPCGHWTAYALTEDGGKSILCLRCERDGFQVRALVAEQKLAALEPKEKTVEETVLAIARAVGCPRNHPHAGACNVRIGGVTVSWVEGQANA